MEAIIPIKGKVNNQITLDPSVWIFDDRKVDLDTYFQTDGEKEDEMDEYTKSISKHWDREIMEGAVVPPTLKTERKFEKLKMVKGTFGIPFKPFLLNAGIMEDAKSVVVEHIDGEIELPLNEAIALILGFSKEGKALKEDGPIHVYYGDGSNQHHPIKNVRNFIIK